MPNTPRRSSALLARLPLFAVLVVATCVALALTGQAALAAPSHAADTAITGVVVNGTHGGSLVTNLEVTLQATGGNGAHDIASATTDAQGRFTFSHVPNGDTSVFAVYTRFQQGLFSTGAITVDNGTQGVTLSVYDTTSSDAALRITSITALVHDPRPTNGLVGIGEYYTFHNSGTTAFLGAPAPANGQPMGLLRFALPSGASNLTLGAGFTGAQAMQVPTGFGATATVPPGDSQFAFAFDLPYTGTERLLSLKIEYPTGAILLLAPPALQVDTQDLAPRGPITSSGQPYDAYTRESLAPGSQLHARLWDLPPAGEPPVLDFGQLVALALVLGLALAALLALYLRRGDLAAVLRLVPAAAVSKHAVARTVEMTDARREAERLRLLRKLARLEHSAPAGDRARSHSRQQAGQIRAELRALLAALPPSALQRLAHDAARDAAPAPAGPEGEAALGAGMSAGGETPTPEPTTSNAEPSRILSGGGR